MKRYCVPEILEGWPSEGSCKLLMQALAWPYLSCLLQLHRSQENQQQICYIFLVYENVRLMLPYALFLYSPCAQQLHHI